MNKRMCIVTRERLTVDQLVRFVVTPSGELVPDLKQKLPGRGCWVLAQKSCVEDAQKKDLFARALEIKTYASPNLSCCIDKLMSRSTFGMMNIARKAGQFITGHTKVDHAVRSGKALASFHATDAKVDGVRKINQARIFFAKMANRDIIPSFHLFSGREMSDAMGEGHYIHAAVLAGKVGESVLKHAKKLAKYRELPRL